MLLAAFGGSDRGFRTRTIVCRVLIVTHSSAYEFQLADAIAVGQVELQ
jgi:hypothetical protein